MAKEPEKRRRPSSSRKRGSSGSSQDRGRRSAARKSPSLAWAKWIEGLNQSGDDATPAVEEHEPHQAEIDHPEVGRQQPDHPTVARLRQATDAARSARGQHVTERHAPSASPTPRTTPERPAPRRAAGDHLQPGRETTPASTGRRPAVEDAPRGDAARPTDRPTAGQPSGRRSRQPARQHPARQHPARRAAKQSAKQKPRQATRPAAERRHAPPDDAAPHTAPHAERRRSAAPEAHTQRAPGPTAKPLVPEPRRRAGRPSVARGAPEGAAADAAATSPTAAPVVTGSARPTTAAITDRPLPDGYGVDRIRLMARDPEWLFAYWEVTAANWQRARDVLADQADHSQLVLRVYSYDPPDTDRVLDHVDIAIVGAARSWYVPASRAGIGYEVELGLLAPDGTFVGLVRSNRTTTPRNAISDQLDSEWRSLDHEFREIFALSGGHQIGSSSLELREIVAHRMQEILGSEAVSSFGASEALAAGRRQQRGFWFVLGTELIVYGATEPDATVTCQGKPIQLRPDGTFTLRFALPDGQQVIPCAARSADGIDTITITPRVEKSTHHTRESLDDPAFTAHASPGDRDTTQEPWRRP